MHLHLPHTTLAAISLALVSFSASAQVYRCPDPASGKLTYSDAPCTSGEQIVRQRSVAEQQLDMERAELARQRFQIEQDRQAIREQQTQARPQNLTPQAMGISRECEIAQKNAWGVNKKQKQREADIICYGSDRAADIRAQEEARKPIRTTCVHNGVVSRCVSR